MNGNNLKYDTVIDHVIRGIRLGIYPDRSKIPSEKDLAEDIKVSVTTVREGLKQLCERDIIIKQQGRRSVVNAAAVREQKRNLHLGWIGRSAFEQMNPVYYETYSRTLNHLFGMNCHLSFLPFRMERDEENILRMFDSFDGFLLAGIRTQSISRELADRLQAQRNVIEIDDIGPSPASYTICTDGYRGGVTMADYLVEQNRRCPAVFLSDYSDSYPAFSKRTRGIIDGLSARRQPFVLSPCGDHAINTGEFANQVAELLKKYPDIDTVWHPQDTIAIAIRNVFETVAPRQPGYYRSCGVDGLPETVAKEPFHASIAHPFEELARLCVETMMNFFADQSPEQTVRKIAPNLIPWRELPERGKPCVETHNISD